MSDSTLSAEQLIQIDGYWRAANYFSVGQIYLRDNALLRRPLALSDVKNPLLGHWGMVQIKARVYLGPGRLALEEPPRPEPTGDP